MEQVAGGLLGGASGGSQSAAAGRDTRRSRQLWWPAAPATPYVSTLHLDVVTPYLTKRDRAILVIVARFKQMRASHLRRLFLLDVSEQVYRRVLQRLDRKQVVTRVSKQRMWGELRGSGEYVYRLGPAGRGLLDGLAPKTKARPQAHILTISELFVELVELERSGVITGLDFRPESYAYRQYADFRIEPDAYIEFVHDSRRYRWFVELDLSRSSSGRISNKMHRYQMAWRTDGSGLFPRTLWLIHADTGQDAQLTEAQRLAGEHNQQAGQRLFDADLYDNRTIALLRA